MGKIHGEWDTEVVQAYAKKHGYTQGIKDIIVRETELDDTDVVICHLPMSAVIRQRS